jgi:hypothetical protein
VVLSGCSLNNPFDQTRTPAAKATGDLTPDVVLAVSAVGLLLDAAAHARAAVAAYPALAPRLSGVIAMHTAHLAALRAAVPAGVDPTPTAAPPSPPTSRAVALKQQRLVELALHDRLTGLALRAESGPFARLLGTMAAAVSQQLIELTR